MKIAGNIGATVQQAKVRNDLNKNYEKSVENKQQEHGTSAGIADRQHSDRIAKLKEDIKNGNYKVNLAATSDKMAQSLLNL